jgi:hypothetical protein
MLWESPTAPEGESRKGLVPMAASTTQVKCPELVCAGCGGQTVTATYGPKTVRVSPCESLIAQGWTSKVQVALFHSEAIARLVVA